jgi:hypothetical protein
MAAGAASPTLRRVIATEPRRLRRALTTAVLTVLVVPLGACTFHDTDLVYTPAQGVNNRDSDVDVLNALIVSAEDGEGRFIAGLSNGNLEEGDELTAMSGAGEDATVQVELEGGDTELPPGGFLQLADEGAARVTVSGEDVAPGEFIRLSLQFGNAEPVELHVPVVEPGTAFAGVVTPSGSPTTETESPSGSATETPAEDESPTEEATEDE